MQLYIPPKAHPQVAFDGCVSGLFSTRSAIYFSPETARRAIEHIESMIAPSGYLFLGPAETLRGLSTAFETTLVGLVAALIIQLYLSYLQQKETILEKTDDAFEQGKW